MAKADPCSQGKLLLKTREAFAKKSPGDRPGLTNAYATKFRQKA
jgi:hypothetical protein